MTRVTKGNKNLDGFCLSRMHKKTIKTEHAQIKFLKLEEPLKPCLNFDYMEQYF